MDNCYGCDKLVGPEQQYEEFIMDISIFKGWAIFVKHAQTHLHRSYVNLHGYSHMISPFFLDGDFINARGFKSAFVPVMGTVHFDEDKLLEFFGTAVQITYYREEDSNYLIRDISGIVEPA